MEFHETSISEADMLCAEAPAGAICGSGIRRKKSHVYNTWTGYSIWSENEYIKSERNMKQGSQVVWPVTQGFLIWISGSAICIIYDFGPTWFSNRLAIHNLSQFFRKAQLPPKHQNVWPDLQTFGISVFLNSMSSVASLSYAESTQWKLLDAEHFFAYMAVIQIPKRDLSNSGNPVFHLKSPSEKWGCCLSPCLKRNWCFSRYMHSAYHNCVLIMGGAYQCYFKH